MVVRQVGLTASFCVVIVACGIGNAADKNAPLPVDKAVQLVDKPADGFGNMSPFELQVHYRLMSLLHQAKYKYDASHASPWKSCMLDEKSSMYARLVAACFLLPEHQAAREFITTQLASKNLRHRYNAAEVVRLHVGIDPNRKWGVEILIKLLADGTIDGSGVKSSPSGTYPQGDRDDIMQPPIDAICWSLGSMKEKKAVPALISVLERRPETGGAAFALGEIGDVRAIPVLRKILKDRSGSEDRAATALGKLKHAEAVPILLSRLGKPRNTGGGMDAIETRALLEALLEIGDKRAVEPIEQYLKGDYPKESKAVARRVLVQLKSPDPVAGLLELLDKETYEPERSDIIGALATHHDDRVVKGLATIARTSDSAFMRREAIIGLRDIGSKQSLLALAALLDLAFSKDLKAEWGWKGTPDFREYFPDLIVMCLKQRTSQDFGRNRSDWEKWIAQNVKAEKGTAGKQ